MDTHSPLLLPGNVTGLTNSAGALTDSFDYDAFGRVMARTGTTVTPFQYGGAYGYYTTSFDLINAWHRWYLPEIGKWLSRDPLGAGCNPYTYCEGLPTVWVDPEGLAPWGLRDMWWDVTHVGTILREVPQADIEVYWGGFHACFGRCI